MENHFEDKVEAKVAKTHLVFQVFKKLFSPRYVLECGCGLPKAEVTNKITTVVTIIGLSTKFFP